MKHQDKIEQVAIYLSTIHVYGRDGAFDPSEFSQLSLPEQERVLKHARAIAGIFLPEPSTQPVDMAELREKIRKDLEAELTTWDSETGQAYLPHVPRLLALLEPTIQQAVENECAKRFNPDYLKWEDIFTTVVTPDPNDPYSGIIATPACRICGRTMSHEAYRNGNVIYKCPDCIALLEPVIRQAVEASYNPDYLKFKDGVKAAERMWQEKLEDARIEERERIAAWMDKQIYPEIILEWHELQEALSQGKLPEA